MVAGTGGTRRFGPLAIQTIVGALSFGGASSDAAHGGVWGFARVLRLEHTALRTQSTDVLRGASLISSWVMLVSTTEAEAAWIRGWRVVARLRARNTSSK